SGGPTRGYDARDRWLTIAVDEESESSRAATGRHSHGHASSRSSRRDIESRRNVCTVQHWIRTYIAERQFWRRGRKRYATEMRSINRDVDTRTAHRAVLRQRCDCRARRANYRYGSVNADPWRVHVILYRGVYVIPSRRALRYDDGFTAGCASA